MYSRFQNEFKSRHARFCKDNCEKCAHPFSTLELWESSDFLGCLATQWNWQQRLSQTKALISPVLTPKKAHFYLPDHQACSQYTNNFLVFFGLCLKVSCCCSVYLNLFQKRAFPWSWSSAGHHTNTQKSLIQNHPGGPLLERESLTRFANWSPSKLNKQKRSTDSGPFLQLGWLHYYPETDGR